MKNLTLLEASIVSGAKAKTPKKAKPKFKNVIGGAALSSAVWGSVGMMSAGPPGAIAGAAAGAFNGASIAIIGEGAKALHDTVHD
jgi:uncharacterized membrane protein